MTKLNQLVAIEKDVKIRASEDLTGAYHQFQKPQPLSGISRTYQPKDDEGEELPSEETRVQIRAEQVIRDVATSLTRLFDVTATKDWANTEAKGTVKLGAQTLIADAPVPYLLFVENQLKDIRTFIEKLPVLDLADEWEFSPEADAWASKPVKTTRTKKVLRNHIKYEATDRHPAQVDTYNEDVVIGYWTTTKYSGALPATKKHEMLERLTTVLDAVRYAREDANNKVITDQKVGKAVLDYIFQG